MPRRSKARPLGNTPQRAEAFHGRTLWFAPALTIKDEPLAKSLWEYKIEEDRWPTTGLELNDEGQEPNLVSSLTPDGTQMPILDLDFPHHFEKSSTDGHTHLYIDIPMSKWRWFLLMSALKYAGVIELGHYVWSIRRGANFVRLPGAEKTEAESVKPTYGWFWKLK